MLKYKRVGSHVRFKYPKHGRLNILRMVDGVIVQKGKNKKTREPYVTVEETSGCTRSFSLRKIVVD